MTPEKLVESLLAAEDAASIQKLLVPRQGDFYVQVASLLKQRADQERLRDPQAALGIVNIADTVTEFVGRPQCRALALWARGNVLIHINQYQESLRCYRKASEFFTAAGADVEAARLMANQAAVLRNLGQLEEGIDTAQTALSTLRKFPPSPFLAAALNVLGPLYRMAGHYPEALAAYEECQQICLTLGDDVRRARAMINQANVLENIDRFEEAITMLQQARQVLLEQDKLLEVARADLNLGIIHTRLGRYDQALAAFDQAERGFEVTGNAIENAVVALYRADLYADFNLYDELLETLADNWDVFEEQEMRWQSARAMLHRAVAQRHLKRHAQALRELDQAEEVFAATGDPVGAQITQLERAAVWCEMGAWERALNMAIDAMRFFSERSIPVHEASGNLLAARCHLELGHLEEAFKHYKSALEFAGPSELLSLSYRAHYGLGSVAQRRGQLDDAYRYFRRAVAAVEDLRQRLRVEDFRIGFLEDKLPVYQAIVILCLQSGRLEEAFAYVEQAKSSTLIDLLIASLESPLPAADPVIRALQERLNALRERLNWHTSKSEHGDEGPPSRHLNTGRKQSISALEQELVQTWREFQWATPFFAATDRMTWCAAKEIGARLRPDEVLVQYYVADATLYLFTVDSDGLRHWCRLPGDYAQIEDTVQALYTTLMAVLGSDRDTVATVLDPMSRQQLGWLYDDLLRPIEHWLEGINRLIIAPDGVLFQVPFHALYSGTHALGEKHEIAYAPSASALRLCRENLNRRSEAQGPVVVMGNTEIEALPHIQRELDAIAAAVPDAVLLTDDQATLAHLQKHAPQSRGLHIASHADFRTDNPFFSALQLAKGEQLRVLELYTLPLQGTLVTLSACETGKHRLRGGDLLGLSRGFFCAGASTLLVSLWPVADVSTTLLMAQFYTLMEKGKTAATALREAQHYLAHFEEEQDGRKIQPYAHPYYWAPFCLLGAPDMRWV